MSYKTNDTEGILPVDLHKKAITFARNVTRMARPHKRQTVYIDAFRECFKAMQELGMVKEEYMHVESDERSFNPGKESLQQRRD